MTNHKSPDYFRKVSPLNFTIFYFVTFGIYGFVWVYKNWVIIKEEEKLNIKPIIRTLLNFIFFLRLAEHIKSLANKKGVEVSFNSGEIYGMFLIFSLLGVSSSPMYWMLHFFVIMPYLLLLKIMNEYHEKNSPELKSKKLSWWVILLIGLGLIVRVPMIYIFVSTPLNSLNVTQAEENNLAMKKSDDAKLALDKKEAQSKLCDFIKELSDINKQKDYSFSVKLPFTEDGKTEHMWVKVTSYKDGVFIGQLANDPFIIKNLKLGDSVSPKKEDVEDWIIRNNKNGSDFTGGFSLKDM